MFSIFDNTQNAYGGCPMAQGSENRRVWADWGEASQVFDEIQKFVAERNLSASSEAQTRFDVIDRILREVLSWRHGQIQVEEPTAGMRKGYIDYTLTSGDECIVVEAKKVGAAFPSPTQRKRLKLSGSVLGSGAINEAISQVQEYGRTKQANVLVVTNGLCWCLFARQDEYGDDYGYLLFPFIDPQDAEALFNHVSLVQVEKGSLRTITNALPRTEDRLLSVVSDTDARVDRNNIADYILPALNNALYADALLENPDALKHCFVTTEARTKFDSHLGMHLADIKSPLVVPAKRIRTGKEHGPLQQVLKTVEREYAPPVTLIIGPVGAGKTTYLKHFEQVSGADVISKMNVHWIYIDFEKMGRLGNPRDFLYRSLLEYLGRKHPQHSMDFQSLVAPAYADDIDSLSRGPLAPIKNNKELFQQKLSEHITKDYEAVEPYVDKLLHYLSKKELCVAVLDNVDLYEDDLLETSVFSEGLALSKRLRVNVIVCIRDTTFVRHKTDPIFDAFELRKLWLDPPPFKTILSSRLSYSRAILKGKHVRVLLSNSVQLDVPDLASFFDIVQRSILQGHAGDHVAAFADSNIRKGLDLVTNFLISGHIQADRAIASYLKGETSYYFPDHEIFKGMMLGQWKHYREGRAECLNLFDARLGAKQLRLLRLLLTSFLYERARNANTIETAVLNCVEALSPVGASEGQVLTSLEQLIKYRLVRTVTAEKVKGSSTIVLTACGGYYSQYLCHTFPYAEACLMDTAIDDKDTWIQLTDLTQRIEKCASIADRMTLRVTRMRGFMDYLVALEDQALENISKDSVPRVIKNIRKNVLEEAQRAEVKAKKYYSE
jgi:predicted type IV restriction endonuclease